MFIRIRGSTARTFLASPRSTNSLVTMAFNFMLRRAFYGDVLLGKRCAQASHFLRLNASGGVGMATRFMHGARRPHVSPNFLFVRNFMSIVKKPENPEDPTALEGNFLGVNLTERAINVCFSYMTNHSHIRNCDQFQRWKMIRSSVSE